MTEISSNHTIENAYGMHARPCSALVQLAAQFDAEVDIEYNGNRVSAKSILGVMTLAAGPGAEITLYAEGPQAQAAIDALGKLITDKFGEE